jgi:hypothetical protein
MRQELLFLLAARRARLSWIMLPLGAEASTNG